MGRLLNIHVNVQKLRSPKFPQDPETRGKYARPVIKQLPKVIRKSTGGSADYCYQYDQLFPEVTDEICDVSEVENKATDYADVNEINLHAFSTNFAYENEFDCNILDVCCDDIYSSSDEDPLLETEDTEVKPSDKMPFGPFKKAAEEKRLKEEEEKKKAEEEERLRKEEEERLRLEEERKKEEEEKTEIKDDDMATLMSGLRGTIIASSAPLNANLENIKDRSELPEHKPTLAALAEIEQKTQEVKKLADKQEKASIADSGIDSPDYIEKQDTNFDMELKKNPIYDDDTKVKPVLCCCIQ